MISPTPPQRTSDAKTGERLSAVERDVAHLGGEVRALGRKVDDGLAHLANSIDGRLNAVISEIRSSRTPMAAMSGWAAVVLTLVGAVIWPQMRTDDRMEKAILGLTETFADHDGDGHPARVEQMANANTHRIEAAEEGLRREINLLNSAIHDTLSEVGIRAGMLDARQDAVILALKERIAMLERIALNSHFPAAAAP